MIPIQAEICLKFRLFFLTENVWRLLHNIRLWRGPWGPAAWITRFAADGTGTIIRPLCLRRKSAASLPQPPAGPCRRDSQIVHASFKICTIIPARRMVSYERGQDNKSILHHLQPPLFLNTEKRPAGRRGVFPYLSLSFFSQKEPDAVFVPVHGRTAPAFPPDGDAGAVFFLMGRSARRPSHIPSRQHMEVQVVDRLARLLLPMRHAAWGPPFFTPAGRTESA